MANSHLHAFLLAISVLIPLCVTQEDSGREFMVAESQLYNDLVSRVNTDVRPVNNTSDRVVIQFGMAINKMMDVNEVEGSIRTQVWLRYLWQDLRLKWNTPDYDDITTIRLPADKIWKPDIVLYNAASPLSADDMYNALTVVYSSGHVLWVPSAIIHSQCEFDMLHYPFDYQTCYFKFGSWTYDGFKVDIEFYNEMASLDISDYSAHSEWALVESRGERNVKYYPCCEEPYPDLTFNLTMRRRSNYLRSIFYSPPVLVSLLLPAIFMLPSQHNGRYLIGIAGLLVMIVQIRTLYNLFPKGRISYLSYYYMSIFAYNFVCLWLTMIVSWVAAKARGNSLAPALVKWIFIDLLGRVLCVSTVTYVDFGGTGEVKSSEGGDTTTQGVQPGSGSAEWITISRILDRIFCLVSFIIIFVFACALIPLPNHGP